MSDANEKRIREAAEMLSVRDRETAKLTQIVQQFMGENQAVYPSEMIRQKRLRDEAHFKALARIKVLFEDLRTGKLNGSSSQLTQILKMVPLSQENDTSERRIQSLFEVMSAPMTTEQIAAYLGADFNKQPLREALNNILRSMETEGRLERVWRVRAAPKAVRVDETPPEMEIPQPKKDLVPERKSPDDAARVYVHLAVKGPFKSVGKELMHSLRMTVSDIEIRLQELAAQGRVKNTTRKGWEAVPIDIPSKVAGKDPGTRVLNLLKAVYPAALSEAEIRTALAYREGENMKLFAAVNAGLVRRYVIRGTTRFQVEVR